MPDPVVVTTPVAPAAAQPAVTKTPTERALEVLRVGKAPEAEAKPAAPAADAKPSPTADKADAEFDRINSSFRALNKREADLTKRADALKKDEAEFKQWRDLKARAKLDPDAWMKAGGVEFDELVAAKAHATGRPPDLKQLELEQKLADQAAEMAAWKKQQEDDKAAAQKRAQENFVAEYRGRLATSVASEAEKYDLVSANGQSGIDFALALADQHAAQHKEIPDPKYILDIAEKYLSDEDDKIAAASKKRQAKSSPPVGDKPRDKPGTAAPASPKKPPTLTNELQGNGSPRDAVDPRKLTGAARVRWALESARR